MWPPSYFDYIAVGVDTIAVGVLYSIYRRKDRIIKNISKATRVTVGPELEKVLQEGDGADKGQGRYIALRGKAHPLGKPIESQTGMLGLMQVVRLKEHSVSRGAFGYWDESVRVIQETRNAVPFVLKNVSRTEKPEVSVEVENPFQAQTENLLLPVATNFLPTTTTLSSTLSGFFTGHAPKGLETTEELLPIGTIITAIGHISRSSSGRLLLTNSKEDLMFPYILSTLPPESIVKRLEDRNLYLQLLTYFLAGVGIVIVAQRFRDWWEFRKRSTRSDASNTSE